MAAFNAGRPDEALTRFRRAQELGDRGPEVRAFVAHALSSAGRHDAAIAEFASLLKDHPRFPGARSGLAPIMLAPERLPRAEKALRAALKKDSRNAALRLGLVEVLRLRAQTALSANRPAEAAAIVRKALAVRKTRELLDVLRSCGCALQFAGELAPAAVLFRFLLKQNPRDAAACISLASVMRAGGEPAKERVLLARALRLDRGTLSPKDRTRALVGLGRHKAALRGDRGGLAAGDRFRALMKLGKHKEAVAAAEKILDAGATLNDIRIFWDPWEWDDRRPREDRLKELKAFERALGPKSKSPWLHYYRAELLGPDGLDHFAPIASFPAARYGWMFSKAGLSALCAARFDTAVKWFKIAAKSRPVDWRTLGFLAETYLCLLRPDDAFAELEKMQALAGPDAGQVLAWRGAIDLWLGKYEDALVKLDDAVRLDAQCAFCWRAAVLLKLGRPDEALAGLDETLRRFPRDFEAYVWRGEAKRALGRYADSLKDLNEESYDDPKREPPIWLWALINRALVKGALGDRAGLEADFKAVPAYVVDYIRAKTGLDDPEKILRAGLELARGFRREEYRQAIWMT